MCFSQNRHRIDSLVSIIDNADNDTVAVDHLLLLGEEYYMNYVDSATLVWEQARVLSEQMGYDLGMADSYNNLGYIFEYMGNMPKSLEYYLKTIPLDEKIDSPERSNSYNNIAKIHYRQGNVDSSYYYQKKCLTYAQKDHNWGIAIYSYCNLGIMEKEKGNYEEAKNYYEQALAIVTEMQVIYDLPKCILLLSEVNELTGNYKESLRQYKRATALNDSIFNESKSKELGKLEANYEFEGKLAEEKRVEEEKIKIESEAKSRKDNLQYSGIFVFVLILFAVVFMSGKFSISEKVAEGLIFFTFLLFFEFCLVLLDPFIDGISNGEPLYKLLLNGVLAGAIFPLHAFFENTLKKRLLR